MSVDPLTSDYPSWTPYAFAMNRVIDGIDLDGLEYQNATGKGLGPLSEERLNSPSESIYEQYDVNQNGIADAYLPEITVTPNTNGVSYEGGSASIGLNIDGGLQKRRNTFFSDNGFNAFLANSAFTLLDEEATLSRLNSASSSKGIFSTIDGSPILKSNVTVAKYWIGKNGVEYPFSAAPGKLRSFYGNLATGGRNTAPVLYKYTEELIEIGIQKTHIVSWDIPKSSLFQKGARAFKIGGALAGGFNYLSIRQQYVNGDITGFQGIVDIGANTYSSFFGLKGMAFGFGYDVLGKKLLAERSFYQNFKQKYWLPYRHFRFGYY